MNNSHRQLQTELKKQSKKFLQKALNLWATIGYDTVHGGYFEALDFDGKPLNHDKRFRIHGRTMFSHAAGTLWGYTNTLNTAERALEFITQKCWNPQENVDGGFLSTTSVNGQIVDSSIKTYEHSFTLLGMGWLSFASKNPIHLEWLHKTWNFVEKNLSHPTDGFEVSIPHDSVRQSNPHMHMFEVMLNLYELFKDDKWLCVAKDILYIFQNHFFKSDELVLREFFTDNWDPDSKKGNLVDPGHHYEWTWLLRKYEKLTGESIAQIPQLYDWAIKNGTNTHGLGYDECYFNGDIYRDTHRLWVQTEALKAHLAMSERSTDEKEKQTYLDRANSVLSLLFKHYFIEDKGLWYDQLDSNLNNISKNSPTSTLYHILVALHEYIQS